MDPLIDRRHLLEFAAPMLFDAARVAVLSDRQGAARFLSVEEQDKAAADRAWAMAEALADAGERRGHVQPKESGK